MTVKAVNKNIIVYEGEYPESSYNHTKERYIERPDFGLLIKVTDYRKGYWAEAPLEQKEAKELIKYLTNYLKAPKLG